MTCSLNILDFFFYQNINVLKDQKIYIIGEPTSSNTKADKKGTSSFNVQYSKADNGYERNQKLQGSNLTQSKKHKNRKLRLKI
jgi:hypothetical protein